MTTTPAMPEPFAWAWRNKATGAKGVYFEDPKPFGITSHPDYEWANLYTEAQALATLQSQPAEVSDAELLGAIARGWCHPKNRGKEVDADLAAAIAEEIRAILALRPQAVPMTEDKYVEQIMEQAQVFASAWSLVGGRFDFGNALDDANEAKDELRALVARAILALRPQAVPMTPEPKAAPKLIGWRTSDYLMETADKSKADNWSVHHEMLPIFEGDPHTKLGSHGITAPAGGEG